MRNRFLHLTAFAVPALFFAACSDRADQAPNLKLGQIPVQSLSASDIEYQVGRHPGENQDKFLNPYQNRMYRLEAAAAPEGGAARSMDSANAPRAQQESDIYKVGKPGSKLLFLLNNYRGLQVVSFEDGANTPKVLSRLAPTGNYPDNMYYDGDKDRLLVLERLYYDQNGNYAYSEEQSRVLVYDVSNPKAPKVSQEVKVEGEIADSRIVGDILYVATSVRPDYNNPEQKAQGKVMSYSLKGNEVKLIEQADLALPVSARENMNIVEAKEGNAYKYYLVASLSQSGWGWWDTNSVVEVVDISSPKGDVNPLMLVNAKGFIAERSQTSVKDNTLIVVSNYNVNSGNQNVARIAVETFKLPTEQSEVVSEDEAEFRRLNIERQLRTLTGDARDQAYERLVADSELGLRGRFVKTKEGKLKKVVSDSVVTVGDTTGQSAALQDVRLDGNLLYVFWVPRNQVDPFDLFDVSKPQEGVKYLKRLQFDGWIERAIPMTYQDHNYVLGLGWTVPNVNNENARRFPQAMLFEVTRQGNSARAMEISQLTLSNQNAWTNFNAQDKYVEVRPGAEGKGSVLFSISQYNENEYKSGGKLIGFDLNAAVAGNDDQVFAEGGLLSGDSGWLRRVFSNPELDRVHTFTDQALGTYAVQGDIGTADTTVNAVNVLELARNVLSYETLGQGEAARGVQIIGEQSYFYYYGQAKPGQVELRLVDSRKADSEKGQVLASLALEGNYVSHLKNEKDGTLLLATRITKSSEPNNEGVRQYSNTYTVHQLTVNGDKLVETAKVEWQAETQDGRVSGPGIGRRIMPPAFYAPFRMVQLASGEVLAVEGLSMKLLNATQGLTAESLKPQNCQVADAMEIQPKVLSGKLYMSYKELVKDPDRKDIMYTRNFLAPLAVNTPSVAACGKATNVPGDVLAVSDKGQMMSDDSLVEDIVERTYDSQGANGRPTHTVYYQVVSARVLSALRLESDKAVLKDLYNPDSNSTGTLKLLSGTTFMYVETPAQRYYGYRYRSYDSGNGDLKLVYLTVDSHDLIQKKVFVVPALDVGSSAQVVKVLPGANANEHLAVLSSGRLIQVLRMDNGSTRPALVKLAPVDTNGQVLKPRSSVLLPGYVYSYGAEDQKVNYTPVQKSLEFSLGLSGVAQVFLAN